MPDLDCPSLLAFVAEARARALTRVVVAWREEFGPLPRADGIADYGRVREATALGYAAGTIIRHHVAGEAADRLAMAKALGDAGFAVESRCRNLTGEPGPRGG